MRTQLIQRLALAATLVAAAAGAQAAGLSYQGAADPYTSGSRSVQSAPSPYTDGARDVASPRDPYGEGARTVQDQREPYTDGARTLAGMDRSGVSAPPARQADPYLDGAYA